MLALPIVAAEAIGPQPGRALSVRSAPFRAAGDGRTDDTAAIQAAMDAAARTGAILRIPAGTYLVRPHGAAPRRMILTLAAGVAIRGDGIGVSVIEVADGAGPYAAIIAGRNPATDLSGLSVADLTFDHNATNNPLPTAGYTTAEYEEASVLVHAGSDIDLGPLEVRDASSVDSLAANGPTVTGVRIHDVTARDIGDDPNHVAHDASLIYADGTSITVAHNMLAGAAVGAPGARTAIEVHGSGIRVSDNTIANWKAGMNCVTSSTPANNPVHDVEVTNNSIRGALIGIKLWSIRIGGYLAGPGITGLTVEGNRIDLAGNPAWGAGKPEGGVVLVGAHGEELDASGIAIADNTITHPLETGEVPNDNGSFAIGWYSSDGRTLANSIIAGNTVIGFPLSAIRLSCSVSDVRVERNRLVNAGSTTWRGVAEAYRSPILVAAPRCDRLRLTDNRIEDTTALVAYLHGIEFVGEAVSETQVLGTSWSYAGQRAAGFRYFLQSGGSAGILLCGSVPEAWADYGAAGRFRQGSRIVDSTGAAWTVASDQRTWRREESSAGRAERGPCAGLPD